VQGTFWADLDAVAICYIAVAITSGINDSCARRESKRVWSEVVSLFIGVVWA